MAEKSREPRQADARIAALRTEIANLGDAIKSGGLRTSPTLLNLLQAAESELARVESARAAPNAKVIKLLPEIADHYRKMIDRLEDVALKDVSRARAELRGLIGNEIRLFPSEKADHLEAEVRIDDERYLLAAGNSLKNQGVCPS